MIRLGIAKDNQKKIPKIKILIPILKRKIKLIKLIQIQKKILLFQKIKIIDSTHH